MTYFRIILYLLIILQTNLFLASCGTIPYPSNTGHVTPDPIVDSPLVWSFESEPNLHPMKAIINVNLPGLAQGLIFLAPYAFSSDATYGQTGSLILDNLGNPIWFRPLSSPNLMNSDFRVQTLFGKPVLTFWQGTLATPPTYTNTPGGSSEPGSCFYILDNTYKVISTVSAQQGFISDIHEFLLTPNNTALMLSTKLIPMDLTPYGGPANGYIQDFAIQEIDIQTNQLIFFWDALQNIPLTDSFVPASSADASNSNIWDVYHLNSIGPTDNINDILVSSRNTWTIYRINKPTGNIIWQLGGKHSNFTIGAGAGFSWQHDARFLPNNVITLFNDNCCESSTVPPGTPYSHGLILQLDLINMTATLKTSYFHDPNLNVQSQGNLQSLDNGNKFIGWGEGQYYSEYNEAGNTVNNPSLNTLYDAKLPSKNYTYRTYRNIWIGDPYYPPSIAVQYNRFRSTIFASWNGSTETVAWQVFAGSCAEKLSYIKTAIKTGFETAIEVLCAGPFFQVKAININGEVIGTSKIIAQSELVTAICQKYR